MMWALLNSQRKRLFALALSLLLLLGLQPEQASAHQPHDDTLIVVVSPDYSTDQTVYVATDLLSVTLGVHVLLKSTDAGLTWDIVPNLHNFQINGLALSPDYGADGTLFASTDQGLFRSTDGSETWVDLTSNVGVTTVAVALSPHYAVDQTVFVIGAAGTLHRSTNGGATWTMLPLEARTSDARKARLPEYSVPVRQPLIPDDAHHASHNPAANASPQSSGIVPHSAIALSPDYQNDQTIIAGIESVGLFKSVNGGTSWEAVGQEIGGFDVTALAFSPNYAQDNRLYASTWGG
ncbi:MAG: hypothetical protein ACRDIB_09430, partial [Ardenticatenaceae bacterium]